MDEIADLLNRYREGDEQAGTELYLLLQPVLRPMIARLLRGSPARCEADTIDIVHSVARRFLEEPTLPLNPRAWLRQVAKNRIQEIQRRGCNSRRESEEDILALQTSQVDSPEEEAIGAEHLGLVRAHLPLAVYESLLLVRGRQGTWEDAWMRFAPKAVSDEAWEKHCHRAFAVVVRVLGGEPTDRPTV
jgi:DNA-directed RNA polymerase specialized sigma24 family protein